MKKWLAICLLFLVSASAFVPCCQDDHCDETEATAATAHQDQRETKACSPFFSCGNCSAAAVLTLSTPLPEIAAAATEQQDRFILAALSNYHAQLLHPPRVSRQFLN